MAVFKKSKERQKFPHQIRQHRSFVKEVFYHHLSDPNLSQPFNLGQIADVLSIRVKEWSVTQGCFSFKLFHLVEDQAKPW